MDEILHSGIRPTMQDVARGRVLQGRGMRLPGYRGRSEVVRFLEKVDTAPGGCWRWRGRIHDNGYTYYRGGDGVWHGHRMAYKLFVGPLDPAMEIDHLCRGPRAGWSPGRHHVEG